MKNTIKKLLLTAGALVLSALTLFSCMGTAPDSSADLTLLSGKLSALESKLSAMEAERSEEISALSSAMESLSSKIDDLSPIESAGGTPAESAPVFFGFSYTEDDNGITITSYAGSSTELILPASIAGKPVVAIGDGAFEGLSIVSVSLPQTVTKIGWFAFSGCTSLKEAVIPKSVTSIGYEAFSGCKSLVIYAPSGSYACRYAESYGIEVSAE